MMGIQCRSNMANVNAFKGNQNSTRLLAIFLSCLISMIPGSARSQDTDKELEPRAPSPSITSKDGLPLSAKYWPSRMKAEGGVVVLLHGLNGNQLI